MFTKQVVLVFLYAICVFQTRVACLNEDGRLNFQQLANKYGYGASEYRVTTKDGYELGLFRIKGSNETHGAPVLLVHGIMDSADTWIIRGNTSLAIALGGLGRDVWLPTCRGGRHSRGHAHLATDSAQYWDFSFHELGTYDLAAVIDTVTRETGAPKVDAIAHSQGNTIFYVLLSTRPEYNAKVNLLVSLAPAAYLRHVAPPLRTLIRCGPLINELLKKLGVHEMFGDGSWVNFTKAMCSKIKLDYGVCLSKYLFLISGEDVEELEPEFLQAAAGHFPSGTSRKNLNHFSQVGRRGELAQYDYGRRGNLERYELTAPPAYNLGLVTAKVALLVGANDKIATVRDVALLSQRLPNVVQYLVMPRDAMNHLDFVWGRRMDQYLFPYIFQLLDRHYYDAKTDYMI